MVISLVFGVGEAKIYIFIAISSNSIILLLLFRTTHKKKLHIAQSKFETASAGGLDKHKLEKRTKKNWGWATWINKLKIYNIWSHFSHSLFLHNAPQFCNFNMKFFYFIFSLSLRDTINVLIGLNVIISLSYLIVHTFIFIYFACMNMIALYKLIVCLYKKNCERVKWE